MNKKIISHLFYLIIISLIVLLACENFIYSNNFGELTFRSIDDLAFQITLKRVHLLIEQQNFIQLLNINDYGYGWIYWIFTSVATYPLYLLNKYHSIAWPLIVAPRQLSLLFSCLTLLYLYKLFKLLDFDDLTASTALLCYSLLPTFGYFSLRFGTVSAVTFFSLLSFYFAFLQYKSRESQNYKSLIALSIAGAIKLNGLFIAPLIGLLLSIRELNSKKYQKIIINFAYLILVLLFFTIPFVYIFPLTIFESSSFIKYFQAITDYLSMMKHFINVTNISASSSSPFKDFIFGLFHNFYIFIVFLILSVGVFRLVFKEFSGSLPLFFLFFLFATILYLFLNVKNFISAGIYFTSISFIFFMGFNSLSTNIKPLILYSCLLIMSSSFISDNFLGLKKYDLSHFSYFHQKADDLGDHIKAKKIDDCLSFSTSDNSAKAIAIDYQIKSHLNILQYPSMCFVYIFSNLTSHSNNCNMPFDYFLIDSSSPAFQNDLNFKEYLISQDIKMRDYLTSDRDLKAQLVTHETFDKKKYNLFCVIDNVRIFKLRN